MSITKPIILHDYALYTFRVMLWQQKNLVLLVQNGRYHARIYYRGKIFVVQHDELSFPLDTILCLAFYHGKPIKILEETKWGVLTEHGEILRTKLDYVFCKINDRHLKRYVQNFGKCFIEVNNEFNNRT